MSFILFSSKLNLMIGDLLGKKVATGLVRFLMVILVGLSEQYFLPMSEHSALGDPFLVTQ